MVSAAREQAILDQVDALEVTGEAVADAAWALDQLAVETLPPGDVDELRGEAETLAYALLDALDMLDDVEIGADKVDAAERAAHVLRELADRRASAGELSRLRQDGRELAVPLLSIAEELEFEQRYLLATPLDDEDDDEG